MLSALNVESLLFIFGLFHYELPLERGAPTLEVVKIKVNAR